MRLDDLPIFPLLPEIAKALKGGSGEAGALALSAQTGAGKTSAVPAYLAAAGALEGKALVLEPRRLAAVSAAARVSELLGTELGKEVGYRVKGDSRASGRTAVEFITEAVFIRMVQDDPLLAGASLVVFDEFHERSAAGDLGLAFASEAREARRDLAILVMSATMDSGAVARYLSCPVIDAPGRQYPVETRYAPPPAGATPEEAVAEAALTALRETDGDVLAFLPGKRELARAADILEARLGSRHPAAKAPVEVLQLHGSLSLDEQRRVVSPPPGARRRVVLSTNVAETSLTVPRISAVVDSGLSRFSRLHAPSGLNRLVTERVSAAEADQRRGRAGRLGPGLCLRCWDEADLLKPSRGPELERIELSGVVLECAVRGNASIDGVRWLDRPPAHAWEAGTETLRNIGLLSADGSSTALGRRAVALGAEVRAAAALLVAGSSTKPAAALLVAGSSTKPAAGAKAPERAAESDAAAVSAAAVNAAALAAAVLSERDAPETDGDFRAALRRALERGPGRVRTEAGRLMSRAFGAGGNGPGAFDPIAAAAGIEAIGDILAAGFPDRLARRLDDDSWEFMSGRRARACFAPPRAAWLLALDADAGRPLGTIRQAAPVEPKAAKDALARAASERLEVEWRGLAASAWIRAKAGVITLGERRLAAVPREELASAFSSRLRKEGLAWLPWGEDSRALVDRIRYAARLEAVPGLRAEDWVDEALLDRLAASAGDWLSASGPVIDEKGLKPLIASLLAKEAAARLDTAVPAFIETPGGRKRRPTYPPAGPARLRGRIQEFFGMSEGPRACGTPVVIELLSPADRPLQVTDDLAGFWKATYPSLRPELSRRYPKHYWPLDPLRAEPTAGRRPGPPRRG